MKKPEGKTFDPRDRGVYFLAGDHDRRLTCDIHPHLLIAVNEIADSDYPLIEELLGRGVRLLIDSGVFALTMAHANRHGMHMDEALQLRPEDVDGFAALWKRYIDVGKRFGPRSWGYIEMDLGGVVGKRRLRAKAEDAGLRPMPVYHPLNDGWKYFDELASQYNRICCGNMVHSGEYIRKRLIWTICERKKRYPGLWIHFLGLTPNEHLHAFPFDSADSSTWLSVVRWNGYNERTDLRAFSPMPRDYQYRLGDKQCWNRGVQMAAIGFELNLRNYRRHRKDVSLA